eukprot:gnl/TRDRNA2_/TRDRNA2_100423_c0_seq1.p1 gnl/TRDRNA2_/TRDRNA2_100423_c0~~gnl/TRDRNA2_/TRDRNA2_100423_c0_seq1.p1  ORF type:complete len:148 (+),score=15.23 gnl/TRDRNA2_/TRDRNA2_100423_c0_seq1:2-445(+)
MWCPRHFLHTYHLGLKDVSEDERPSKSTDCTNPKVQDASKGWSMATAIQGTGSSSNLCEHVQFYCPLPADLRAALARLAPIDEASGTNQAAWLGGDVSRQGHSPIDAFDVDMRRKVLKRAATVDMQTELDLDKSRSKILRDSTSRSD